MMEACTLALYQKNIFRVTGLPVDAAHPKSPVRLRSFRCLRMGEIAAATPQPAYALIVPPTTDEIRNALTRMKDPSTGS